ncbi:TIGR01777 family oxidoreductase [Metabacillus sp. RGM 3146]|uniref:TIGR01777 family oxidoreductase n=1 Tax=Metabacillus sp. RGM 3146 TaxID=3401092 RepID=UPI003B9B7483
MKVAIAGGSGFVGSQLTNILTKAGHEVLILTRSDKQGGGEITYVQWMKDGSLPEKHLDGIDAIVNLAGKNINDRWTDETKKQIIESRVEATNEVYRILNALEKKPSVLVNASAVGIYGTSSKATFIEEDTGSGNDFLAKTAKIWENEAKKVGELGIRLIFARFGVLLGKNAGALPKMMLPYKLFLGGNFGSGEQWISWIHAEDAAKMILFAIENKKINGPMNVTAPNPVQNKTFGKTLAKAMNRRHWLPAPAFALKAAIGEMSMLVLDGQRAIPKKALEQKYAFSYPTLDEALTNIIKSS